MTTVASCLAKSNKEVDTARESVNEKGAKILALEDRVRGLCGGEELARSRQA